jgi:hypothetical protein
MKKPIVIIISLLLILALAACSSSAQQTGTSQSRTGGAPSGAPRELPLALKLALGTFKLDGTNNAVDAQEAQQLLPLWKAALALGQSDTTAQEEMTALINQIQNTMTPDQIKAIDAMGLIYQDMATIAQEQGISIGGGGFGNLSPEARSTMQAARASGQSPQGGFGGGFPGGGPGGGGGGFSGQARQTSSVSNGATSGVSSGVNPALLNALIKYLETKAQQ